MLNKVLFKNKVLSWRPLALNKGCQIESRQNSYPLNSVFIYKPTVIAFNSIQKVHCRDSLGFLECCDETTEAMRCETYITPKTKPSPSINSVFINEENTYLSVTHLCRAWDKT